MALLPLLVASTLQLSADAPVRVSMVPTELLAVADAPPPSLIEARRLAEHLRYEEAVVEYERYLGQTDRPAPEQATALIELGFIHLVLGDTATARKRALEGLRLDPRVRLSPDAPAREVAFVDELRKQLASQAHLQMLARREDDPPNRVRALLTDPNHQVQRVLLRYARQEEGPFYSSPMRCLAPGCEAELPEPSGGEYTAFYYVEALDAAGNTLAEDAGPVAPLRLTVIQRRPWYTSPWFWGLAGAALAGAGAVVYLTAPTR